MIENNVQEKLTNIKQKVIAQPSKYEFSSYLEYFCGTEIGHFSDVQIGQAAKRFVPTLEQIFTMGNLAQELKQPRLPSELFRLNKGAAILGFCYLTEQFLNDLRILPDRHYWAIWFCLEILEHLATNNITNKFIYNYIQIWPTTLPRTNRTFFVFSHNTSSYSRVKDAYCRTIRSKEGKCPK